MRQPTSAARGRFDPTRNFPQDAFQQMTNAKKYGRSKLFIYFSGPVTYVVLIQEGEEIRKTHKIEWDLHNIKIVEPAQ